ncbi:aminotransferase class III-fold pyridoxal phosphate-dependent enzyme, partial [Pseudomonas protegens]|uniref:aminotransferase class III-fold pyridoxal phosphate-dependent enzyme n=1 Tax=Pseudomonas protegens TaxID=380021 RepID=UPI001FF092F0
MSKTNASLMKRREAAVPRGVGQIHPIFADSAKNATVTDVEGREFIDFAGGIAVLNTGHVHPKIIAAVTEQLNKLTHTCFQVLAYEPYVELCEKINAKVPGDFAKKTLLVTTGSEAVENAVKIARAATGRAGVIAFTGAYHVAARAIFTAFSTASEPVVTSRVFLAKSPGTLALIFSHSST